MSLANMYAEPHVTIMKIQSKTLVEDALRELDELFNETRITKNVDNGIRLVTKQQGKLELPETTYRCQVIGCEKRKKMKQLPQPQIPEYIRDKKWKNKVYSREGNTATCLLCNKTGKYNTIQQHCKQHFLPEYQCLDCGDAWHIKGQWQQHFLLQCPHCPHVSKGETNLKTHIKKAH